MLIHPTRLIAITGGSGSGKTFLADRLQRLLGSHAGRLSLDDFYLDRSNLPPSRLARLNFDHPRAIDWPLLQKVLADCRAGRATQPPHYNFKYHARMPGAEWMPPGHLVLVEGLWLLRRPALRALFDLSVYLDCPTQLRLERRLERDAAERGRTPGAIRDQFWRSVVPMHERYVASQSRWATIVLREPCDETEIARLAERIRALDAAPVDPAMGDAEWRRGNGVGSLGHSQGEKTFHP